MTIDTERRSTSGGSGGTPTFVIGQTLFDIPQDSNIEYSAPFGAALLGTNENQRQFPMPVTCTAKNLVIELDSNSNLDVTVFTLRINFTDTALTISVPALMFGTFVFDADVTINEEDLVDCKVDNTLNTQAMRWTSWSSECQI